MDYDDFCKILKGELSELPINRKERFYTGTILPALLFHNGLNNFYTFLQKIDGFPPEIDEAETKDNFLFYTEYNLKQSAGKKKNVGRIIPTETNETPDAIIEILKPKKVFIVIESKMFHNVSQTSLSSQISKQRKAVIDPLKQSFKLKDDQVFHVALVPRMSQCKDGKYFQVINWEFFIDNGKLNFDDSGKINLQEKYFYNYLKFALDNYESLVATGPPQPPYPKIRGQQIYEDGKNNGNLWVGRQGGRKSIKEDVKDNEWRTRKYYVNPDKSPPRGRKENWITSKEFTELVGRYSE